MRRALIRALATALVLTACAAVVAAQEDAAQEYEVMVGDRTYAVKDGEPKVVSSPNGEIFRLLITKKDYLAFSDDDLSFSYHPEMKAAAATEDGVKTVTVDGETSALFMAQVYPGDEMAPDDALQDLLASFQGQFEEYGATFPRDRVAAAGRTMAGELRSGKKLRFFLGELLYETEVFAFPKGDKTIALIFQANHQDRDAANDYFEIIQKSLK